MTTWEVVTSAVALALGGHRADGRRDLLACWDGTFETHHAQWCVLAHYLAGRDRPWSSGGRRGAGRG